MEIRLNTNKEQFVELYKELSAKSSPIISQSLTFSKKLPSDSKVYRKNVRLEMEFVNGVKKGSTIVKKETKGVIFFKRGHIIRKINVASETPSSTFNVDKADFIRFKYRSSIELDDSPWRFDFTMVKNITQQEKQNLKKIKESLFVRKTPVTGKDFIEHAPMDMMSGFEVEVEYTGPITDMNLEIIKLAIDKINAITKSEVEDSEYQNTIFYLASKFFQKDKRYLDNFRSRYGIKQLVNQPQDLTSSIYKDMFSSMEDFYLSDKADGERSFILFRESDLFLITHKLEKIQLKEKDKKEILFDAELIREKDKIHIYVFDVLIFGEDLFDKYYEERVKSIEPAITYARKLSSGLVKIDSKPIVRLDGDFSKKILDIYNSKTRLYPIDGLIFTPATIFKTGKYRRTKYHEPIVYKWKPPSQLTIDFLIMEAPKTLIGIEPYGAKEGFVMYILFTGINYNVFRSTNKKYIKDYSKIFDGFNITRKYFPIQFSPPDNAYAHIFYSKQDDLNSKVGEFCYSLKDKKWILTRMRPDKDDLVKKGTSFGNDYAVANTIWQNINNPLTLDLLQDPEKIKTGYFSHEKDIIYKAPNGFNSFVKTMLLQNFKGAKWIIDLAAGKGQDLFRYSKIGVENGLFVDIDSEAIAELNRRSSTLKKGSTRVYSMVQDLSKPYKKTIELMKKFPIPPQVEGIAMNFAIHYLLNSRSELDNIIDLVDNLLKPGGRFVFTCFDGKKIHSLLKPLKENETWSIFVDEKGNTVDAKYPDAKKKFSIKKLYPKDAEFKPFQLKIGVWLPFSKDYYQESLVDIDFTIDTFEQRSFEREIHTSFEDYLDKFKIANPPMYKVLTSEDKEYVGLYTAVSLWKVVKPVTGKKEKVRKIRMRKRK